MTNQEPIRVFNVCDENNSIYEVKVFKSIIDPSISSYKLKPFRGEIMYIQDNIVIIEESPGLFRANIDGIFKDFHPC